MSIEVERLTENNENIVREINALYRQLKDGEDKVTSATFAAALENGIVVIVRSDDQLIGIGSLNILAKPRGTRGVVGDIVIHEKYRRQGLGEKLLKKIIEIAKEEKVEKLWLTSRPVHTEGNELYAKLGFKIKETNFYQLKL